MPVGPAVGNTCTRGLRARQLNAFCGLDCLISAYDLISCRFWCSDRSLVFKRLTAMMRARSCLSVPCSRLYQAYTHPASSWNVSAGVHGWERSTRCLRLACVAQHQSSSVAETLSAIEDSIGKLSHSPMVRLVTQQIGRGVRKLISLNC